MGPVEASIESNSRVVASGSLVSFNVTTQINKIPFAQLVLLDGDVSEQDFPLSDGPEFKPGAKIEVKAGYDGSSKSIFKGIVIRHRLKLGKSAGAMLMLDCRDDAYAMTLDRKNASFLEQPDSAVFKALIGAYSSLSADVTATTVKYGEMVQYYCSDWDYILSRAEANGHVVIANDGKITIGPPKTKGPAALEVTHGVDILDFDADIDARTQIQKVESVAWDPTTQKTVSATATPDDPNKQGNLTGGALAKAVGTGTYRQQSAATLEADALTAWAKSRQLKAGMARIQGKVTFAGSALARVGSVIRLNGVGERFDGDVYVTRVEHQVKAGEWLTTAHFGLAPQWFTEQNDVVAPMAAGRLPGIGGLHIGVVTKLDEDPEKKFRVQVSMPILGPDAEPVWARVSRFYSSNEMGAFFIPEVADEVLLGFMSDDPSSPVILGSLYSSKLPPPYAMSAENNIKGLVTRSKMKIEFDDEKKILTIFTPQGNQLVLDEDNESVSLEDQNNNSVVLDASGITLDSPKNISIKAGKDIAVDAAGKIAITAAQDITLDGMNITQSASVGFTSKGGASAEFSASGQTTVKGAMVLIN